MLRKISKKAEGGVFGMSFGMIFSIILIVFFIIVAGISIKFFLGWQKCSQLGLLIEDIKKEVDDAFYSNSGTFSKEYTVPSNVKYVCFANLSAPVNFATAKEQFIYNELKKSYIPSNNLYFYSPEKELCITMTKIEKIDINTKNPICFQVVKGKINIRYERNYDYPLVKIKP